MTLYVRLEIHPGGDRSRARIVGEATIENVSECAEVSDYRYTLREHEVSCAGTKKTTGAVVSHKRSDGPWRLLGRVIEEWQKKGSAR